jgi:hypothetical protein
MTLHPMVSGTLDSVPDEDTRQRTHHWFSRGGANTIPSGACHLVLLNTYICDTANLHSNYNLIEVTLSGERGTEFPGFEKAYFSAHQIREWLLKNCKTKQRKKHCLSTLREQTANQEAQQDRMYSSNV